MARKGFEVGKVGSYTYPCQTTNSGSAHLLTDTFASYIYEKKQSMALPTGFFLPLFTILFL